MKEPASQWPFLACFGGLGFPLSNQKPALESRWGLVNCEPGGAVRFSLSSLGQVDFRGEGTPGFSQVCR